MPYRSPFQSYVPQMRFNPRPDATHRSHHKGTDSVADAFVNNASADRINTNIFIYNAIKAAHPDVHIVDTDPANVSILGYIAATGDGSYKSLSEDDPDSILSGSEIGDLKEQHTFATSLSEVSYIPPYRRLDGGTGTLAVEPIFSKYLVEWQSHEFLIYTVDHRDGTALWFQKKQYILTNDTSAVYSLLKTAGFWMNALHGEIWVFDQGWWQKDPALYQAIQKADWDNVILPADLKEDLLKTILRFFNSRESYTKLHVPWKRGLIFYGPPGNGKTITIKATMKTLYDQKDPILTLYVKSLASFGGPQYAINEIFQKARQQAPCYLVFEDLDSLVTEDVRSFFLNAVDGLSENEGILMIGSTNHLERLDPGIAKRPSRFDRKYLFPDPDMKQRIEYCKFWQRKLKDNKDVAFPDKLLAPIAGITDGFSFAYMQEAFVSTLLKIANDKAEMLRQQLDEQDSEDEFTDLADLENELVVIGKSAASDKQAVESFDFVTAEDSGDEDLNQYVLWREIKAQIANLKKELDKGGDDDSDGGKSSG